MTNCTQEKYSIEELVDLRRDAERRIYYLTEGTLIYSYRFEYIIAEHFEHTSHLNKGKKEYAKDVYSLRKKEIYNTYKEAIEKKRVEKLNMINTSNKMVEKEIITSDDNRFVFTSCIFPSLVVLSKDFYLSKEELND